MTWAILLPQPTDAGRSALKMMTPRKPIEVARLIASGRWKSKHIASYREQFGDDVFLDVLLCAFVDDCSMESLTHFDCQQTSGKLLLEIMPETDRPLRPMIRKSLAFWNPSVEEWPFFLCRRFGIGVVSEMIDQIAATDTLNETEQRAVQTFRYWLRAKSYTILGAAPPG